MRDDPDGVSEVLAEAARLQQAHGVACIDGLVISMTRSAEDVLLAEQLVEEAGVALQVVPLLETVADLRGAPALIERLLDQSPRDTARGDGGVLGLGEGRWRRHRTVGDLPRPGVARLGCRRT